MVKASVKKSKLEVCKGDFSVDQKVIMEKSRIEQIQTLAYVCSLMHSHKTLMDDQMRENAIDLAEKCLKAANKLADTLEI